WSQCVRKITLARFVIGRRAKSTWGIGADALATTVALRRSDCRLCFRGEGGRKLLLCERAVGFNRRILRGSGSRAAYFAIKIRCVRRKLGHGFSPRDRGRGSHPRGRPAAAPQAGDARNLLSG